MSPDTQNSEPIQTAPVAGEEKSVVEQQAETAKEVKKAVKKSAKQKAKKSSGHKTVEADRLIKAASNPPRPDVKKVEKGDLLIPVEEK